MILDDQIFVVLAPLGLLILLLILGELRAIRRQISKKRRRR